MGVIDVRPPARPRTTAPALPTINRDQKKALAAAQGVLLGRRRPFLLEGRAGTGKTRLIVELVRRWPGRVAVCAPTHKAAAVLDQMLLLDPTIDVATGFSRGSQRRQADPYDDTDDEGELEGPARVAVGTIHSLLGLQPLEDDQGRERLVPIAESTADQFSLIVIDEASMVGRMLQNAIDAIAAFVPVLYAGDIAQLPPVGEATAPCFSEVQDRVELTEIVRQQQGNPILRAASALRDQQPIQQPVAIDTDWAQGLPPWRSGQPGVYEATMDDIFAAFRADPDCCRLLAFRNSTTIAHNKAIREAVIGRTATPFIPGEKCLVRSPVIAVSHKTGAHSILIPVNAEPEVLGITADTIGIEVGGPLWKGRGKGWPARTLSAPVWRLVLLHEGARVTCTIERAPGMRDNWMSYATEARRWDDRWRVRAALADIRHLYSVTTHTSQGCTYDIAFIDMRDLLLGGMADRMTRLRLLYTAATRPSMQLGVLWEPWPGFV